MSRALVTGATSAYGSALARRLRGDGEEVRLLVRDRVAASQLAAEGFDVAEGDLRDAAAVDSAVRGCDRLFHVAALFQQEPRNQQEFFDVNVEGTRNLLEAAVRHGVQRVVHVSTIGVHGSIVEPPANEGYRFAPDDAYRRSKLAGEQLALSYLTKGLALSVVRPSAIYGPGDRRMLKLFRAVEGGWFVMLGRGEVHYHLIYLDDLVEATLRCARETRAIGEVMILAGPRSVPLSELIKQLATTLSVAPPRWHLPLWPVKLAATACQQACRLVGVRPPLYPRRLDFFTDNRSFDTTKARELLAWEPQVDLAHGLAVTRDWYCEHGWLPARH